MEPEMVVPQQSVPILAECDVLVCGGGPAGIAAAVSAARHGCEVVLLERWPSVGGMAANALVNIWHTSDRTRQVIFGLVQEFIERGRRHVHRWSTFPRDFETHWFDPEAMQIVFHDVLDEAGVRTICNLTAGDPIVQEGRIRGVLADTKTGRKALLARMVIDATGDGDVAAKAGLPFDLGREDDGRVQGMTMMYRICGLDEETVKATPDARVREIAARMREARDRGDFPPFNEGGVALNRWSNRCIPNMCPVSGDPLDEEELTQLTIRARRQVFDYLALWRREMPGLERAEVEQTGFALGVRESRRVRGLAAVDREHVVTARKTRDALGHGFWLIDIHDPLGAGHTTYREFDERDMPPVGESYHLPLGICLNDRIANLAVVGRCASATHEGCASIRLQSHCMVMGQGVGACAALALDAGVDLCAVDMTKLQSTLRADGVRIEDVPSSERNSAPCLDPN